MDKIKRYNLSLKVKIQLILITCILLISCVSLISIYFITRANQSVLHRSVSDTLSYSAANLSRYLNDVDTMTDLIYSNDVIQTQMASLRNARTNSEKNICRNRVYAVLCDYLFNFGTSQIDYISIIQKDAIISTSSLKTAALPDHVMTELIRRSGEAEGASVWVADFCDDYGLFFVKDLRQIEGLTLDYLGTFIIQINLDRLVPFAAASTNSYNNTSYLLFNGQHCIYNSGELTEDDLPILSRQMQTGYQILKLNGRNYFTLHDFLTPYGWNYVCIVPYDSIMHTILFTLKICIAAFVLCIPVIFLSSSKILASFIRHIDRLLFKMKKFGEGSYERVDCGYDYGGRTDEISLLHNNFDSMTEKVKTLIQENYINEILTKEAQLKALESQINPHFLYNTLNSINWRAKSIGAADISQITIALGNLLRITLSKHTRYTLKEELTVLDHYITIQKLRYGDRLEYRLNIPKELADCEIPKLTLQPLIENAIRYGLEAISETCCVSVSGYRTEDCITIEVKNNGSAFEEDLLEKLECGQIQANGFGIGLLNIHKRLKIAYGPEFGLSLTTAEDEESGEEYAIARIHLPYKSIGEEVTETC